MSTFFPNLIIIIKSYLVLSLTVERELRENRLRSWAESAIAAEDRIACRQGVYSPVLHLEND